MLTVWAALGESGSLQSVLSCSPEWSWREAGGWRRWWAGYEIGRRVGMGEVERDCGVKTGGELNSVQSCRT